ncbi:MAG: SDR family NAD(P)-dependent oxidoreductase [Pseudomonadota bacterium]
MFRKYYTAIAYSNSAIAVDRQSETGNNEGDSKFVNIVKARSMQRWVFLSGASSRLGQVIAKHLLESGRFVVLHGYQNFALLDALCQKYDRAIVIKADFSDPQSAQHTITDLQQRNITLCALINNAATFSYDQFDDFTPQSWEYHMRVNALTPTLLAREFITMCAGRSGHIINIVDAKILAPNPDFFSYSIAKSAMAIASEMIAMLVRNSPISCNIVAPGPMLNNEHLTTQQLQRKASLFPTNTPPKPQEICAAIDFILSSFQQNGISLPCDSGLHLHQHIRDIAFLPDEHE